MKNENMKKNNKGFSLVELIVVIAIMAVLMVILAPAMLRYVEKTRVQKDESALSEIANAAELALGDETVYNDVVSALSKASGNDVTVVVTTTGITCNPSVKTLHDDIVKTTSDGIKFASKQYQGVTGGVTIKLVYDSDKEAFVVAKSSSRKPFSTNAGDLNTSNN